MPWFELACGGVPDGLMFHGGTTMPDPKALGQTRRQFPRIAAIIELSPSCRWDKPFIYVTAIYLSAVILPASRPARLFPHSPGLKQLYEGNPHLVEVTAQRNSSLQGAYLTMAARSLGLDCGPMSSRARAKWGCRSWTT